MGDTLNVKQVLMVVRKRIWLIVSMGLVFAATSGLLAVYAMTPVYEASRQLLVNNTKPDQVVDYNTVMTNFQYTNTYNDMIYSEVVLEKVIQDLKLNTSYEEFVKQISVTSKKESQVITITVEDANYPLAIQIVNEIATVFKSQASAIMKVDNVELFPPTVAKTNPEPVQPKPVLIVIVALLAGVIIGFGTALLLDILDNTISSEQDIEELLSIPAIGVISTVHAKDLEVPAAANNGNDTIRLSRNEGVGGRVG